MKTILVIRSPLLPLSETFIKQQIMACKSWAVRLVGRHPVEGGLSLAGLDTVLLPTPPQSLWHKLVWKLLKISLPDRMTLERLRAEKAGLVHVHFATELVGWWHLLKPLGLPVIATLHGFDINTRRDHWERHGDVWQRRYPAQLLKIARHPKVSFIAVSEAIRRVAIDYGIPPEKITVQYIGVNLDEFKPQPAKPIAQRRKRILFVGRMVEKKGAAYLIEAFAKVRRQVPDAELVMIGSGPLLEDCKQRALDLNAPVEFPGGLPSLKVAEDMENCRLFCLPSVMAENGDAEGLGMVILEAQACGVPVVTSALGGAAEAIIDGKTGFAFQEKDVEGLAAHLVRLLTDDTLATFMSAAARAFVEKKFDIVACTAKLEAYYDEVHAADGRR